MILTWSIALLLSYGLRSWGIQHQAPFIPNPLIIFALLLGPAIGLGIWLLFLFIQNPKSSN